MIWASNSLFSEREIFGGKTEQKPFPYSDESVFSLMLKVIHFNLVVFDIVLCK